MEKVKLFIEGFIVGLGKIMPGVSGSLMAICFGIYERLISCLSSFKNLKNDCVFFFTVFAGIGIAIVIGSNVIKYLLENHFLLTLSFFIGMMIPGTLSLFKNVKGKDLTYKRAMLAIIIFFGLFFLNTIRISGSDFKDLGFLGNFISLLLCGVLDAAATIIPGISGSALLMIVGYYDRILSALANPFGSGNVQVLIPFLIGLSFGVIAISKLITYLFSNYRETTYILIITLAVFSIFALLGIVINTVLLPVELIISCVFIVLGITTTRFLEKALAS